jgi:hypothetical protein
MARLPVIAPEEAKGKARSLLSDVQKKLGLVPNMMRVMANSPAALDAYLQFSSALEGGSLDAKCRERIALETADADSNRRRFPLRLSTFCGGQVWIPVLPDLSHDSLVSLGKAAPSTRGGGRPSDRLAWRGGLESSTLQAQSAPARARLQRR